MSQTNAIQKEIAKLTEHWQTFLDGDQAILHWLIKPSDVPLANTFIKIKEQFDLDHGEWFIQLTGEFKELHTYAYHLADELNDLMADGLKEADGLQEADGESSDKSETSNKSETPPKNWQKPDIRTAKSGFDALFQSCNAILNAFDKDLELLTLCISPSAVKKPDQYAQWWDLACKARRNYQAWPPKLKWLVLDSAEKPFLKPTFAQNIDVALTQQPPLDFNGAARAVAEQANDGTDGAAFRIHLLDMNNAIGEKDKSKLEQASVSALALAEKNQWWDMWATALMTRAGGWLNFKLFNLAIPDYRLAQTLAQEGVQKQMPGCDKLLLQALLFEGTAYFMANELEHAAKVYQRAAEKAEVMQDSWICLEAWRMASLSMERFKKIDLAWPLANQAFAVGRKMTPEAREQSTLAFVGQAMLRISPNHQVKTEVKKAFDQLLGETWLEQVEAVAA